MTLQVKTRLVTIIWQLVFFMLWAYICLLLSDIVEHQKIDNEISIKILQELEYE